jgi:hypothetical protein
MNGIFQSLSVRDLLKTSNRSLAGKVAALWDQHVAKETDYMERDNVILEGLGHWLKQSAWTDDTGFFMKLRLHPSYKHQQRVQESARKVVQGFVDMFPGRKNVYYENREALDGGTETITVVVETGSYSIGD